MFPARLAEPAAEGHRVEQPVNPLAINAMDMFRTKCVDGIEVDVERGRMYAERSTSIAAALNDG